MDNGTVKWFNKGRGYGFVMPDDGGKDIFLHVSAWLKAGLTDYPEEGDEVRFEAGPGRGGKTQVTRIELR